MSDNATFSTDAASLSAVFAAWFAANPGVISVDAPVTLAGEGVRVQAGPMGPPVVTLPTGSFVLALDDYAVQVFAVTDGKQGARLLDFTLGATLTATASITGDTLSLTGVTGQLHYDGQHSEIIDAVLDYLLGELVGRGETWPLPQMDRLLGLKATLESVGTEQGTLAAVVALSCEPKAPPPSPAQGLVAQTFHAQITARAQDGLVQDVLDCVFRPVHASKSAKAKLPLDAAEVELGVSLTLDTPTLTFDHGRITGKASTTGTAEVRGWVAGKRVLKQSTSLKPTAGLAVKPTLHHSGTKVVLELSVTSLHLDIHISHVPHMLTKILGEVISDVANLLIGAINLALGQLDVTLFELDNPYAVFGLDAQLSFGALSVDGHDLTVQVSADTTAA